MGKITGNEPAHPMPLAPNGQAYNKSDLKYLQESGMLSGLTIRQVIAKDLMAGMLQSPHASGVHFTEIAQKAVQATNALIDQLNMEPK